MSLIYGASERFHESHPGYKKAKDRIKPGVFGATGAILAKEAVVNRTVGHVARTGTKHFIVRSPDLAMGLDGLLITVGAISGHLINKLIHRSPNGNQQ